MITKNEIKMKKKLFIIIFLLSSSGLFAQGLYNNGGKIVIGPGACVYINGNYQNETNVTDASIDLSGTIKIKGDYINNVANSDIISNAATGSEIQFNGTTNQSVWGSTTATFMFPKLTINNAGNNVIFLKDLKINDSLKLMAGLVDISNNNLTFGPTALVSGTPSVSSMIIASGAGQVKKELNGITAFTFPIGDNNNIIEYAPVSLNFTAGTFLPGAFVGVNLVNSNFNDPLITGSYLNRYWNITQTGISGFTCDAVFQYNVADIVGTESSIYCLQVIPAPFTVFSPANTVLHQLTATGLTSFGTFTGGLGVLPSITLNLNLQIQGLYIGGGLMRQAQGIAGNQFPGNTADQITVELHNATVYSTIEYAASNVDLSNTGTATLSIPSTFNGSYYITVKHRNSLQTVSSTAVSFAGGTVTQSFGSPANVFGGNLVQMPDLTYAIFSGDVDQDGFIGVSDMASCDNQSAIFGSGYLPEDIDGDGFIGVADMAIIDNNSANFISAITP